MFDRTIQAERYTTERIPISMTLISTPTWRKSTRSSDPEAAQCVEVATVQQFGDVNGA